MQGPYEEGSSLVEMPRGGFVEIKTRREDDTGR